jgi:general secretion pathway protein K
MLLKASPGVNRPTPPSQEGVALLLILWVLILISAVVLGASEDWTTEARLARNFQDSRVCRQYAEAGVNYALGKLVAAKMAERAAMSGREGPSPDVWQGDHRPHVLELSQGQVEVRVSDESGKINLNTATPEILARLLAALGLPEVEGAALTDAMIDWRTPDSVPTRPLGVKSDYYLRLDPPYPSKNGLYDLVEEVLWVKGFDSRPIFRRLPEWLTVYETTQMVNLNTAAPEVLLALGLPPDRVQALVQARQGVPFRNVEEVRRVVGDLPPLRISFQSSPFFTILSTGMINNSKARHTIKAVVRIDPSQPTPWEIIAWADDYPG